MAEPTITEMYTQMMEDPFFQAGEGRTKEETARVLANNRFRQFKNNEMALSFTKQMALDIADQINKQMRHPDPNKSHLVWNPGTHRWTKRQNLQIKKPSKQEGQTKPVKAHPKKAKGKR